MSGPHTASRDAAEPRPGGRRGRAWLIVGFVALLGIVAALSLTRAVQLRYDFHHFYRDARYVWTHGALNPDLDNADPLLRRQLPFYLPVVPLALAPLTAGGLWPAALAWAAGQVLCLAYSLRVLWRWRTDPRGADVAIVGGLLLPAIYMAAFFNQLSFPVLALLLAGMSALERRRDRAAGLLFGLAVVLKLLPALLAVWLILKRRWTALAALIATVVVVTILPPLAVFGSAQAWDDHCEWWAYNVGGAPARGLTDANLRSHFIDHHNQGLGAVIERLTAPTHPFRTPWQPATLGATTRRTLTLAISAACFAALVWATRRPAARLSTTVLRGEFAVYALAMLVLSPLLRDYYFIWAAPALLLLVQAADAASGAHRAESPDGAGRAGATWPAAVGVGAWVVGLLMWLLPVARLYGVHWLVLAVMGAALLCVTARASARRPPVRQDDLLAGGRNG